MRLRLLATLAGLTIALAACGDDGGSTPLVPTGGPTDGAADSTPSVVVTPPPPPAGIPPEAAGIGQTTTLGRIVRSAGQDPQTIMTRELVDAACEDGVVRLETPDETVFAALPCDRFWDERSREAFVGEEVAVQLEVTGERFRVLIETVAGAQTEFTVDGIWVQ